ncbi:hypothetical protein THAOC_01166 [Thalassiosira oceanica]|uniref:Uncharacterized protein n=1 Tax=Thalassiosira oceanica TaxID=159749 RepID=K0TNC9_THAOC|nr:hypothetical protein THAOC_01166 [Thalassiosira oceanica]|eukprot:EJK77031.1 hypothetical protein THAOC_01166 [Thalassiosira oceanica]
MIRLSAFVTLAAALSTGSAFVPTPPLLGRASTIAQPPATAPRTTSLDGESATSALGTRHGMPLPSGGDEVDRCSRRFCVSMEITAIDTVSYALGNTDEVKGTGVWSAFQLKRDKDEEDEDDE